MSKPETEMEILKEKTVLENKYRYVFLDRCIRGLDGSVQEIFREFYRDGIEKLAEEIVKSTDEKVMATQAYAVASKMDLDGRHWYRVREMMGDRRRYAVADAGGLKIGNESFSTGISTGSDGEVRYAVLGNRTFNRDMLTYRGAIEGSRINIYAYDCGNEIAETLSGRYGVYSYEDLVIFEKWDD